MTPEQIAPFMADLLCCEDVMALDYLESPEHCLAYLWADSDDESEHQKMIELQFPIAAGLYEFCAQYHSGQSDRLYQIMSCMHLDPIGYDPGPNYTLDTETALEDMDENWDDRYVFDTLVADYNTTQPPKTRRAVPGNPLEPLLDE